MSSATRPPTAPATVEQWDLHKIALAHRADGDPFAVAVRAHATSGDASVPLEGFYDGDDVYRVRFMPPTPGRWTITVHEPVPTVEEIEVVPATGDNHGPVRVRSQHAFAHADGTPFQPLGTTCYVWNHQRPAWQEGTLRALAEGPFTKIRMCVFPKNYAFNEEEPARLPMARDADGTIDHARPDPAFYRDLERQLLQLRDLGVEADLILFHPYDKGRWGFDRMTPEQDVAYIRYTVARLAAFRNVWWSLANEYDFMWEKTMEDWHRILGAVHDADPSGHLCSIHNGTSMYKHESLRLYDHLDPRISHVSLQHWDLHEMPQWIERWGKPVVVDECGYEGDLPYRWGNLTGEEMVERIWTGTLEGGHVGHGETFHDAEGPIWWSHGGVLHGESPRRIAFLREILDQLGEDPVPDPTYNDVPTLTGSAGSVQYFGRHRPVFRELRLPDAPHRLELVDTWRMTREPLPGEHRGTIRVDLPARPGIAILMTPIAG